MPFNEVKMSREPPAITASADGEAIRATSDGQISPDFRQHGVQTDGTEPQTLKWAANGNLEFVGVGGEDGAMEPDANEAGLVDACTRMVWRMGM
ncbi:hypothetical protein [Parasitella parasitica]|uniref:Uncharacterized protein n=1 Tax=Parasitella parasitica TaxID=35722 RepID=A0A0B7NXX3_9FUNG|nr:hypothetical protein [Parasitella parasitica]